ncbi:MAG: ABC transporter permease [Gemmatimonadetes bacterium]|nr:ABC transporter permease [Gemmatimonadota bacterium]
MLVRTLESLGRGTRTRGYRYIDRIRYVGAILRSALHYPATTRPLGLRVILNQIRFTAVQALPFLSTIALVIGVTVIVQAVAQRMFGLSDILGRILVTVVVRELGPLLTAIIVIGRSGTAIAAELATDGVLGETEAMESMGVDPLQYLVAPRVIGGAISVALLTIYFDTITLVGGSLFAWMLGEVSLNEYFSSLRLALQPSDLWITLIKGGLFGAGIATLCSYEGLIGGKKPTDIPQCVTRGVVASILFVFLVSTIFSLVLYA